MAEGCGNKIGLAEYWQDVMEECDQIIEVVANQIRTYRTWVNEEGLQDNAEYTAIEILKAIADWDAGKTNGV